MATTSETMFVRIKPYNPRKGYVLRRVTVEGQRFDEDRWYEVGAEFAARLEKLRQKDHKPESPPAFDVVTREQADEMDARRRREAERSAATATKVTSTRDLPRSRSMRAATEEEPPRRRAAKEEPEADENAEPAEEETEDEFPEGDLAPATEKVALAADGAAPAPAPAKAARAAAPKTRKRR